MTTTAPTPSTCPPDPRWADLAGALRSRLLSVPDGGLVELLVPGSVVGLTRHGPGRVLLSLGAAGASGRARPAERGGPAVEESGSDTADCTLEEAVSVAVRLVRDVLGLPTEAVEVWRPGSPPPAPTRATTTGAPAPGRARLW